MKNLTSYILIIVLYLIESISAQVIIKQTNYEDLIISSKLIPANIDYESEEFQNFVFNLPLEKLLKSSNENQVNVLKETTTIYMEDNNLAADMVSEEMGRVTMVFKAKSNIMSTIMWKEKKIMEMKQSSDDNLWGDSETDENLYEGENNFNATGRIRTINGFECEEFIGYQNESVVSYWMAEPDKNQYDEMKKMGVKLGEIFQDEEEEINEWEIIPGKIPIEIRTLFMFGEPTISIETIEKIESKSPPSEIFNVPGKSEGFTKMNMMDVMQEDFDMD